MQWKSSQGARVCRRAATGTCVGPGPIAAVAALGFGLALAGSAAAQPDLAVSAFLQPTSACALDGGETVSVRLSNPGSTLPVATTLNLAYSIDGGTPVVEPIVLAAPLATNVVLDFSFATLADLSVPGTYVFDAAVHLPGDADPSNDVLAGYVVIHAGQSVGGIVSAPSEPTTAGTLTLSGRIGAVVEWQQSVDGLRWRSLENTTPEQAFAGLESDTFFRVQVQDASCAPVLSDPVVVRTTAPIFGDGFEP
jgi:hypothetical protein